MENRAFALATGLFVVLLTALALAGAVWLSGGTFQGVPYDLITEQSVAGLAPGAPVRLRGVEIGHVQSIEFAPSDRRLVRVRALVDPKVPLMAGTYATLRQLGLSGSDYVELNYPNDSTRVLVTSPAAPARIPLRATGFALLTDEGDQFLKTFSVTLDRVNAILTPQTAQNVAELLSNLNAATARMATLARDLGPATRRINVLLADADRVVRSTQPTVQEANGALDALRDSARGTGQAVHGVEQGLVNDTLPRIDALSDRLARDSDTLDQLLQEFKREPQSVIFGLSPPPPGPGEPGFRADKR